MFILYYLANILVGLLVFYTFIKSESVEDVVVRGLLFMPLLWRVLLLN